MLRLEAMRRANGWSKAELARRSVLNEVTVIEATNGKRRPGETQLHKLARALGVKGDPARLLDEVSDREGE